MPDTRENIKKWTEAWQQASAALEKVKKQELRDPDYYEKHRRVLDDMLQYAFENRQKRLSSGLVEQQRWFIKLRGKA